MQSYLNPFVIRIAVIFGPQRDQDCSHIWTVSKPRLHSYLDPIVTEIAIVYVNTWNAVFVQNIKNKIMIGHLLHEALSSTGPFDCTIFSHPDKNVLFRNFRDVQLFSRVVTKFNWLNDSNVFSMEQLYSNWYIDFIFQKFIQLWPLATS